MAGSALGPSELAPLDESGGALGLEVVSAMEASLLVDVVVDEGVNGDEGLQRSLAPKAWHRPFPSSQWLVRARRTVVRVAPSHLTIHPSASRAKHDLRRKVADYASEPFDGISRDARPRWLSGGKTPGMRIASREL
jgi:hypothetical protein